MDKKYRFDFALILLTGLITRYRVLRPLVEADATVSSRWIPIRTWFEGDWLAFLPGSLRLRVRHLIDSRSLYLPSRADAILIHAFETYYMYVIAQRKMGRKVVIVNNPDAWLPQVSGEAKRDARIRFAIRETDAFVFWSSIFAQQAREDHPDIPEHKIHVMHPGIDLKKWPLREPKQPDERFKILFVGGDLMRKGADTLIDAFETYLSDTCELHIATQAAYLPPAIRQRVEALPHAHLHLDYTTGSDPLRALFREADVFAMPTNKDAAPFVALESMATGLPIVISPIGGIPEIVMNGEAGLLVPPKDPAALAAAIKRLRDSPELREKFTRQGRAHVEENYDANRNTEKLLDLMKRLSDERKGHQVAV